MKQITVILNGREVEALEGMTILELAKENGIDIPTLCHNPELRAPIGSCRICVVEVEGSKTLVASCHTPIKSGMVIHTHSPAVLNARRIIVELLLMSHPDNCLVCDKANLCKLRQIAADLGVGISRFRKFRRYYPIEDVGPYIIRDLGKCILCRQCLEACRQVKGEDVFAIAYRSFETKVVVDFDQPLDKAVCKDCDVCVGVCPVGALVKRKQRFLPKEGKPLSITG